MKQTTLNSFLIAMKTELKELAQCGAVILRMMEFVKKQADAE